jgi:Flp pilus assembly protein TadD
MDQAGAKLREGKYRENVQLLREAADIDPTNPQVWGRLCDGYRNTDEFDLAVVACRRQIEIHPSGLDYNSLGIAYMGKKDYANAVTAFETAVKDFPDPAVYGNLVWALQSSQQYDKAIRAAQRGVEVTDHPPSALAQALGILIGALEDAKQYERAIPAAERMVEVSGKEPPAIRGQALRTLIWAQVCAEHYDRAIAGAQRLVEASAGDPTDLNMAFEILGAIYMKLGDTKKAHQAFAKVPKINSRQIRTCEVKSAGDGDMSVTCYFSR